MRQRMQARAETRRRRIKDPSSDTSRCVVDPRYPVYVAYHDEEWGVPSHDDRHLFEMLVLEGAQAGLSWITILKKRENYRRALDQFDPNRMAQYGQRKIDGLLKDPDIVRNRRKVEAAVDNARAFLGVCETYGSFDAFIWRFVDGQPIVNRWRDVGEIPAWTPQSDLMSKELKKLGFRFVGSTICYAYMQAVGMVNDHVVDCFRFRELAKKG